MANYKFEAEIPFYKANNDWRTKFPDLMSPLNWLWSRRRDASSLFAGFNSQ